MRAEFADGAAAYRLGFLAGLKPEPKLSVSDWADEHRFLSPKSAAEPGRWRTERTPYLREILDCLANDSPVERVVFKKGSQVGGSETGLNLVGYVIHHAPGPMLVVQPSDGLAERFSKQRLAPMIETTPALRELVKDSRSRDSGNTILEKDFPGGHLIITGANVAAGLASMPIRVVILDETDRYPKDVDGEGSPIELAVKRTSTFARKKIFEISTPTNEGESHISAAFEETDQRFYFVPCPECGAEQVLRWHNIRWEKLPNGKPDLDSVHLVCEGCDAKILEHQKTAMLARGRWIPTKPLVDHGRRRGYHLSALYSPVGWYSWREAVDEWAKAQGQPAKLRVFINTVLGEAFQLRSEDAPEWRNLYARRETYPVGIAPARTVFITGACDVQKDRLEVLLVGWNRKEAWVIEHRQLLGDTSQPLGRGPWAQLDAMLAAQVQHETGSVLGISAFAIDSGYNTSRVYEWGRSKSARQVFVIKGQDALTMPIGAPRMLELKQNGQRMKRGVRLWPVGSSMLKGEIYGRLKQRRPTDDEIAAEGFPETYLHFPELHEEFFKQACAEQLIMQTKKGGHTKPEWIKTYPANEALDLLVYNLAMFFASGANRWDDAHWQALENDVGAPPLELKRTGTDPEPTPPPAPSQPPPPPSPQRRRSSFW